MTSTHSHATPRVVRISTKPADEAYRSFLARQIAEAGVRAFQNLKPAVVGFTSFETDGLISCRRFLCEPNSVAVNPFGEAGERVKSVAGQSDSVIGPAGPIDPQFSIISLRHQDGTPLAILGNFSVHYCGGYSSGMVSADYFGVYCRYLESAMQSVDNEMPFTALMSNGTSGDTGSFRQQEGRTAAWTRMEYFGEWLAKKTIESLESADYSEPKRLRVKTRELELGVRKPSPDRLKWAKTLLANPQARGPHRWSRVYAQEAIHLANYPARYSISLQAIQLDSIGIAAAPCEIFAETGLAIKRDSPLRHTFTMELANGYSGYLPTRQQHELGGYETWPARSSHLELDAEKKIRSGLIELLHELEQ